MPPTVARLGLFAIFVSIGCTKSPPASVPTSKAVAQPFVPEGTVAAPNPVRLVGTDAASLRAVARDNPYDFEAHKAAHKALAREGRVGEMIELWTEFLGNNPEHGPAYIERAALYFVTKDYASGREDIKTACYRGDAKGCQIHRAIGDLVDEVRVAIEIQRFVGAPGPRPEPSGEEKTDEPEEKGPKAAPEARAEGPSEPEQEESKPRRKPAYAIETGEEEGEEGRTARAGEVDEGEVSEGEVE
ncbi:MAG: hypothetical protein HYV07_17580 [Deltaproteobacteria bacterium]|nr:hypothetical protein [Deltaproteobacteria bacterium]